MLSQKEEMVRLNIIITKKDLEMLRIKAEHEDSSLSRLVRMAVRKYILGGISDD